MSSSGLSVVRKAKRHQPSIKPLRVLILATSSVTRARLQRLLEEEPDVEVVCAISGADDLAPSITESDPDVVLLQLAGGSSGTDWEELIALAVPVVLLAGE